MRYLPALNLTLLATLSGCASVAPEPAAAPVDHDCRAEAVPGLLGKQATAERVEQARLQTGAKSVRVLAPGDAVTLDYNRHRLNIDIDEAEMIRRISCG
ncbi:I78 family peptidase inhibitor [Pseudomonas zhanjiangensis]|uniref:I78 family peptidase inhibitor n=1 Tax=Pseudomonas zhanjiangensis TaxID=3239015 RepID=A0ABV3YW34_9PSED